MIRRLAALVLGAVLAIAGTADAGRPSRPWDAARWQIGGSAVVGRIIPDDAPPVAAPWYRAGGAPAPWGAWDATTAASEAASWLDLTGGGHSLAEVGAGTGWSTAGWTPGGVGALSFGAALGASDTMCARVTGCPSTGNQYAWGAYQASPTRRAHWATAVGGRQYAGWRGTSQDVGPAVAAGVFCIAGGQAYRDGAAVGAPVTTGDMPSVAPLIGGLTGAFTFYSSCTVVSAARWTETLTASQVAAVSAAMP